MDHSQQISESNSKKLDRIINLLDGDGPDSPGMIKAVSSHAHILHGNGNFGVVQKVNIMWRLHVWVLCTLSGLGGYLIRHFVK
jgi:hypothetical protein